MCRLFAQISPQPQSAREFLVDSEFSLLRQSNFNKKNLQKDGWGLAFFGNKNRIKVFKSLKPVFKEAERFKRLASENESRVIIGHLRAASNPRGIPLKKLISLDNTQPYTDGRWAFAHNGTLQIPDEVAKHLGPLRKNIKALNDSEVYFWQFIKFQRLYKDPARALRACIQETWGIWEDCKSRYPQKKTPYTSLNALLSDGTRLYAMNHFVSRGMASYGNCNPTQPWSVMSLAQRGSRIIAASENLDQGPWTRLVQPEILSVEIKGRGLAVKRRRFEIK